ncbi:AAA domain-containing protein [Microbispora cellulosiformans]|uniref:AAA domain-containing protein n=1 Tax=Microbispora cellulosiformans TaxID=2614688 RepID=A0A5J5K6B0_9ACTN|nr:AAA family ATPase [Microbispora cellulosiformans]KAA9379670.1 AAA domain-containing protein [Microbispora cellulosiformans]
MTTTAAHPAAAPADPGDGSVTSARLRQIVAELDATYHERSSAIRAIVAAMLAQQHSLLIGPPGTAKSELARDLTDRIQDARLWEIQLNAYTAPTAMFGPIDVAALMQGRYEQVWDGRATTGHIAFIDEIFKCSPASLNALLAFLNERVYHPEAGGAPIPCPLISAVTASNELPTATESAAIYDRLLVRVEVDYIQDATRFADLLRTSSAPAASRTRVLLTDLQAAVGVHVPAVGVPDQIIDAVVTLRAALRHEGLVPSDRRWRQIVRLLQAHAWLDGRAEVATNDLAVLAHALWDSPATRPTVEKEVLNLVNPSAREALELRDAVEELNAQLDALQGKSTNEISTWAMQEAMPKLKAAGKKLQELHADSAKAGRSTATLEEVMQRHTGVFVKIMTEALQMPAAVARATVSQL